MKILKSFHKHLSKNKCLFSSSTTSISNLKPSSISNLNRHNSIVDFKLLSHIEILEKQNYLTEPTLDSQVKIRKYNEIYDNHIMSSFQFINLVIYKDLFLSIIELGNEYDTRNGLLVLNDFIIFQYDNLLNKHRDLLLDMIYNISKKECGSYKMYYLLEEVFLKNITTYESSFIIKFAYSFALGNEGSIRFYKKIIEEILKRKVSSLTAEEYVLLYNCISIADVKDDFFWVIMKKANEEKFYIDKKMLIDRKS